MNLQNCNAKYTTADKVPLVKDEDGDPCIEKLGIQISTGYDAVLSWEH